jgi:hypothetical protein
MSVYRKSFIGEKRFTIRVFCSILFSYFLSFASHFRSDYQTFKTQELVQLSTILHLCDIVSGLYEGIFVSNLHTQSIS